MRRNIWIERLLYDGIHATPAIQPATPINPAIN